MDTLTQRRKHAAGDDGASQSRAGLGMLVSVASIMRPGDPKNTTELNFENSDELFGKWDNSGFQRVDGSDGAHYVEPTAKNATLTYSLYFQARST